MSTIVDGLVKIGKTGTNNFEQRMYILEHNGYCNITGLKRHFAIEVDDYSNKELIIDELFSKSNIQGTELFAVDINLVVQLLSSFEGKQIYPEDTSKKEMFEEATDIRYNNEIPNGEYYLDKKPQRAGEKYKATMAVKNGQLILLKGSNIIPREKVELNLNTAALRNNAKVVNNFLQEDIICPSPSTAASIVNGHRSNGWAEWKTKDGKSIDCFRKKNNNEE